MIKFLRSGAFMALISGLITAMAVSCMNMIIIWICFVPLFTVLESLAAKKAFNAGLFFGAGMAFVLFFWMIPGAQRFTNSSIFYGLLVFVISGCLFGLFFALITWSFSLLKLAKNTLLVSLANGVLIASLFCIGEALLTCFTSGFPWFDFHAGYPLASNVYAIQPASFFGVPVLSFVVLLVNYLVAAFTRKKQWLKLLIPVGLMGVYLLSGYLILGDFKNKLPSGDSVNVAILTENIPPEVKWNDHTGDSLATILMSLAQEATDLKPAIALWSESSIPWTYRKDDDLVGALLKITEPATITHILGINTETGEPGVVYNSAYCLAPDGKVSGRYDKQALLTMIEQPWSNLVIPFMSSAGFTAKASKYSAPLSTPFGKAGIIICNEATVPEVAYQAVSSGATFLCNMSNDGWFRNSYLVDLHFYAARLRAVETRKDMVVNSNCGYTGLIEASGEIALKEKSDRPMVQSAAVVGNHLQTLALNNPWLFTCLCLGICILAALHKVFYRTKELR